VSEGLGCKQALSVTHSATAAAVCGSIYICLCIFHGNRYLDNTYTTAQQSAPVQTPYSSIVQFKNFQCAVLTAYTVVDDLNLEWIHSINVLS